MPKVIILADVDLDSFYKQIRYMADQKFHNYQPHFTETSISEREAGELETYSTYANHASSSDHNFGRPV